MIHYLNSALDALEKLFRLQEKRGVFKTAFRIVLSLAVFILLYFAWQAFTKQEEGPSTSIQVVESDVRFWGELVEGTKISIQDKIRHTKPYEFEIDSPSFFDRCVKTGTRNYFSELGYSQKDIIDSKVIDTLKGKEVIGRTLLVELPLPDTRLP